MTTINIIYTDGEIEQYGIWADFIDQNWNTHRVVEALTVKWDFLVSLPQFNAPQRHTILVKFSSEITPLHLMKAIFSDDLDNIENIELENAPTVCRIDFINHVLSEELMQLVENWHKSLIKEYIESDFIKILKKYRSKIARFIHYSIPFIGTFFSASILNILIRNHPPDTIINLELLKLFMYWGLGCSIFLFLLYRLGYKVASKTFNLISNYEKFPIFNFTNGDKNNKIEIEQKNIKSVRKFITRSIGALIFNIISSLVTYFLFQI